MRAVEERYLKEQKHEVLAERETHRLRYVYFLERLVDVLRMPGDESELREVAKLCRDERARYLGMSAAEADAEHGTVIEVARGLAEARGGAT